MKKLLTFSIALFYSSAFAYQCGNTVNSKKTVLFVDVNLSAGEVEDAAKAACERGESFKSIPDGQVAASYRNRKLAIDNMWDNFDKKCRGKNPVPSECDKEQASIRSESKKYYDDVDKNGIDKAKISTELSLLAKNNVAVSSLVISGHDGGGNIHGAFGGIDKEEIIDSLKAAYKTKPNLLDQLHSVFMWGCWTMGPGEVSIWRDSLPSIKMLGGFFDMAPLAATSASHTVLHDLLVKEKSITEQSDKNKIKNLIAGVENINQTYAAVYAESNCGKDLYYYNTKGQNETQNPNFTAGNHFVDFNKTFDCKTMAAEIEKNRLEFMKYYNGTLPIPTNTTTSPLRSIYAFVRSSSQCIPGNSLLNGDRILMMVFSDAVKENFAEVFGDVTKKADSEFKFLDAFLGKYNPKGAPMKQLKDYLAKNKNKYFSPTADVLKTKDRKQIKEMISFLDGLVKQPVFLNDKNFAKKAENLKKLEFDMETYLYQMDPSCMDALEWHEHEPGHKPHTYCSPKN